MASRAQFGLSLEEIGKLGVRKYLGDPRLGAAVFGPVQKENLTLEDLERTWMAQENLPSLFISATDKKNIDTFRELLYREVRKIVMVRYPENQER